MVGALDVLFNGMLVINLVVTLFTLVMIESSSQNLGWAYVVLLTCSIFLDDAWFILFSNMIRNVAPESYKYAEVLSTDAFSTFEEAGKAIKENGHKCRETIIVLGGGKPPLVVFVAFRGRQPSPDPLLRHNVLLPTAVSARA